MPWHTNGSLNKCLASRFVYRYIHILEIHGIYLYNKREFKNLFRLPFVGHGIPWIRPKRGPQVYVVTCDFELILWTCRATFNSNTCMMTVAWYRYGTVTYPYRTWTYLCFLLTVHFRFCLTVSLFFKLYTLLCDMPFLSLWFYLQCLFFNFGSFIVFIT